MNSENKFKQDIIFIQDEINQSDGKHKTSLETEESNELDIFDPELEINKLDQKLTKVKELYENLKHKVENLSENSEIKSQLFDKLKLVSKKITTSLLIASVSLSPFLSNQESLASEINTDLNNNSDKKELINKQDIEVNLEEIITDDDLNKEVSNIVDSINLANKQVDVKGSVEILMEKTDFIDIEQNPLLAELNKQIK